MNGLLEYLVRYGAVLVFAAVFVDQMGIPLPAIPWLLAAGALAGTGKMNGPAALGAAVLGSMLADMIWFYLGRYGGRRVLSLLCRISLEPDTCVRKTDAMFTRSGMRGVVMAKFIPGVSTLVPPLAGASGVSALRFLLFDGLGSLLFMGGIILVGVIFRRQLDPILNALAGLGRGALVVVVGLFAIFIAYKYVRRQRLLHKLRMARITPDELHQRLEAGENVAILDLRSRLEVDQNPVLIRGAIHMTISEVQVRLEEIPRDRDIILYCACPNEVTSARAALLLHRHGILRVRPLLGGIDAWQERNYPVESRVIAAAGAVSVVAGG